MTMWKKQAVAITALAAAATVTPAVVSADNTVPRVPAPSIGSIAHVLKPGMLAKVPANTPGSKVINVKGTNVRVSKEQLSAYDALSPELRAKLGAPRDGAVLGASALKDLANKEYSTVMCPW